MVQVHTTRDVSRQALGKNPPQLGSLAHLDKRFHLTEIMEEKSNRWAKFSVLGSLIAIIVVTILEFPSPIGFETRPQDNVSIVWLFFLLAIVISMLATALFIFIKPSIGKKIAIVAGVLNILQVIADQMHLMQPEVAPLGYSLLEGAVVILSLVLVYSSSKVRA